METNWHWSCHSVPGTLLLLLRMLQQLEDPSLPSQRIHILRNVLIENIILFNFCLTLIRNYRIKDDQGNPAFNCSSPDYVDNRQWK